MLLYIYPATFSDFTHPTPRVESLEMRKGQLSKLTDCRKETFSSSKSKRVVSVAGNTFTSKRASLDPEKVGDKVINCGWVGVKSPNL